MEQVALPKARRGAAKAVYLFALASLATTLGACQSEPRVRQRELAIAQGSLAPDQSSVLFLAITQGQSKAICTASLISPQHLLTAAHCVTGQFGEVDCAADTLAEELPATEMRVSMVADLQSAPADEKTFMQVEKASVVTGASLCGRDLALVTLTKEVSVDEATPLLVGAISKKGESYRAYGYGAGHASGTGEGIRRVSDVEEVVCVGMSDCDGATLLGAAGASSLAIPLIASTEFVGSTKACPGDSGGPAVSEKTGAIIGVLSRGYEDCSLNVFSQVQSASFREFIRSEFAVDGHAIPAWALEPEEPDPDPPAGPTPPDGEALGGAGGGKSSGAPR